MAKVVKDESREQNAHIEDDFDAMLDKLDADQDAAAERELMTQDEREYVDQLTSRNRPDPISRYDAEGLLDAMINAKGKVTGFKGGLHNLTTILNRDPKIAGRIGFNVLSGQVVVLKSIKFGVRDVPDISVPHGGADFNKRHEAALSAYIASSDENGGYGIAATSQTMEMAILNAAQMNAFDPLYDAITSQKWDGVPRLDTAFIRWFSLEDNEYHRQLSKFFLVFIERRVKPGVKFDHVPVLISRRQGTYKSSAIGVMSLGFYGEFRTPQEFSDPKKMIEATDGAAIMEVPEMAALLSLHHNVVKSTITSQKDRARGAYSRYAETRMRAWLMIGTSNDGQFLRDPTGNRRFWPIYLNDRLEMPTDIETMRNEIHQVYAEALVRYRELRNAQPTGDLEYQLTGEAAKIASELQGRALVETPEQSIAGWLSEWLCTSSTDKWATLDVDGSSYRTRFCVRDAFNAYHTGSGREVAPDYDQKSARAFSTAIQLLSHVSIGPKSRFDGLGTQQSYVVDEDWLRASVTPANTQAKAEPQTAVPPADLRDEWEAVENASKVVPLRKADRVEF